MKNKIKKEFIYTLKKIMKDGSGEEFLH